MAKEPRLKRFWHDGWRPSLQPLQPLRQFNGFNFGLAGAYPCLNSMNPKAYYIFGAYSKVRFAAVSGPFGMHKYIAAGSEGAFQAHLCGLPLYLLGEQRRFS